MRPVAATSTAEDFRKLTVRDAAVLLVMAWLIPFLLHLVPWSQPRPLGAYLLPMFWATFVAVYFYGIPAGLITGLCSPAINLLVTGLPAWRSFGAMGLELVVFVLITGWAVRQVPRFWLLAPMGYCLAKTVTALILSAPTTLGHVDAAGYFFAHIFTGSGAGLIVLTMINAALIGYYPKGKAVTGD